MSFKILTASGEAIAINRLDEEAAAFWGKEVQAKSYTTPDEPKGEDESEIQFWGRQHGNWFDIIGHQIHSWESYNKMTWKSISQNLLADTTLLDVLLPDGTPVLWDNETGLEESIQVRIIGCLEYIRPYIALMKHWEAKGYVPVQIK